MTQEAIDYISTVAVSYSVTSIDVFNLTFTSDWENYGVALPSASEGVQMAIGAEYREEFIKSTPDEVYRAGSASGQGGNTEPIEGYLAMDLMGSYVFKNQFSNPLVDYDCAGYFGFQCGQPIPDWRHRFRATWESNFRLNLSLSWRYVGEVINDDFSPDDDLRNQGDHELWQVNDIDKIDAYNYFDLAASYTLRNGLKFTLGVNNVLDEEPPLAPAMADDNNINMYGIYDPAGRYVFGSVQFNF